MRPIRDDYCLATLNLIKIAAQAAFYCGYVGIYHMTIIVFSIPLSRCQRVVTLQDLVEITDHFDSGLVDLEEGHSDNESDRVEWAG